MKTFQDLTIQTDLRPEETIAKIAARLPEGWMRDQKREVDLTLNLGGQLYCFELKQSLFGSARLWAAPNEKGLAVTNIVPIDKSELTADEYNEILRLFVEHGVKGQFQYSLTKAEIGVSDVLSDASAVKLKVFSSAANKSSGHSHPLDAKRWLAFIYSTVKNNESPDSNILVTLLKEDGWDEESAEELAADFSYGARAMRFAIEAERDE